MKKVITAQELGRAPLKIQNYFRKKYPTYHAFDLRLVAIEENWKTTCTRCGLAVDLWELCHEAFDEVFGGCLPDLTISQLLEAAQERGKLPEGIDKLKELDEPIEGLWRWVKEQYGR